MTRRIYIVGTDTGVGKTALTCALLHWARSLGVRAVPFKPAQSGAEGSRSDADRLREASGLEPAIVPLLCPLAYGEPIAPGLADDPAAFLEAREPERDDATLARDNAILERVAADLAALQRASAPDLVLIEGAGGLHVPMPGGTWQPQWIDALADAIVVVTRDGLGTINHTLLTLDALATTAHVPVLGLYACSVDPQPDPSRATNLGVITSARAVPLLGHLAYLPVPDSAGPTDLLTPLLAACSALDGHS